jgi:hypothetical protein
VAHVVLAYFDQRLAAALRAIVLRSAGESLAALALPPLRPPSRPRATAAGFRLSSADGLASVNSPVAISTISLASWFGSLGRLGFFATFHIEKNIEGQGSRAEDREGEQKPNVKELRAVVPGH